jgi:hypothetical protein
MVVVCAPVAWGQAITGFTGGTAYTAYHSGSTGDVVGWRFNISAPLEISDLGVWIDSDGLTVSHQVGIWDGSQALVASTTVSPGGTVVGDWIYESITPVVLMPGDTFTAGVVYASTDGDSYISGASSVTTHSDVTWLNGVYPSAGDLGFVYPTEDSAASSGGRFGPNFLFTTVPVELQSFSIE